MSEAATAPEWARDVQPEGALRFADIEAEVLARPLPPASSTPAPAVRVGAVVLLGLLALAIVLAPIVGTGVLVAHVVAGGVAPLLPLARIALVVVAALPWAVLAIWWLMRDRHRAWWDVPATAGIGVLSGVAAVIAWTAPDVDAGTAIWATVATVSGVGVAIAVLVASRPGPPTRSASPAPVSDDERRYLQARAATLRVLVQRGLVDGGVVLRGLDLPLGELHRLDEP